MENLLSLNFENYLKVPFHAYLKDKKGKYIHCNNEQAKSFGYSSDDGVIGAIDFDFLNANEANILRYNDLEIIASREPKTIIESATFHDLSVRSFLSTKVPLYSQSGKIIGIFGTSIFLKNNNILNGNNRIEFDRISASARTYHVTKREKECLIYLVEGLSAKEIARALNLSPRTIEFYIENIKKKFCCKKRTELVAKALDILKS